MKNHTEGGVRVDGAVRPLGWIVELYGGTQFLAPWQGDPGRTCVRASAKRYVSEHAAKCALARAMRVFPNRDYSEARVVAA